MNLGQRDEAAHDQLTRRYNPHPANVVDDSTWNDNMLLDQLILLTDSGLYAHLSRLVKSPEEYQYMQVLFVLALDLDVFGRGDWHDVYYLRALPKLLGLPNLVSYVDINEFVTAFYIPSLKPLRAFFEDFLLDPVRSGRFHHDLATWHAFAASRFLRFFSTASSR